jgi:hypothetical protein
MSAILGEFSDDKSSVGMEVETLIGSHMCITANSGAGKSGTIRKLLETTHGAVQHIVIDVEDEFYTLRERFEYLIAGGENGDCAANPNNAEALATMILKAGFSAILQINSLSQLDRESFIEAFLSTLTAAPRALWRPMLVVLDEAQFYAPQVGNAVSSEAVINFMMLGRKRGFTGILATPRAADLDKRATAPVNNWLIGRCGQPADRRAAAAAVGFSVNSQEAIALRSLPARSFWAFGPALSLEPRMMIVGKTETTIVKAGQATLPTPPAPAAMRKILADLNAAAAQAEEATSESGATNRPEKRSEPDPKLIEEAEARGYRRGYEEGEEETLVRVGNAWITMREKMQEALRPVEQPSSTPWTPAIAAEPAAPAPPPRAKPAAPPSDRTLTGAAPGLLQALARLQCDTWEGAAILSGIVPGNGYYYKGRKQLLDGGHVIEEGGRPKITAKALKAIGPQPPMTLKEIVTLWTKLRAPGPQMLTHLARRPAEWIETDELAAALSMKAGNGYWYKGIKVMREANLIEQEKGRFRLSELLRGAAR